MVAKSIAKMYTNIHKPSELAFNPKGSLIHLYLPNGVTNVVMLLLSSSSV